MPSLGNVVCEGTKARYIAPSVSSENLNSKHVMVCEKVPKDNIPAGLSVYPQENGCNEAWVPRMGKFTTVSI